MWQYEARLNRVIDGDTFVLEIDLGFHVWTTQHVRLQGLDCPEKRTAAGVEARAFTVAWFTATRNQVIIETLPSQPRTFERWVADVHATREDARQWDLATSLRTAGHVKA